MLVLENKIKLVMHNKDNMELIKFKSLEKLFEFIELYTVEKLIDSNSVQLHYDIIVEE